MARHFPSGDRAIDYAFDALKTHGAKVDAGHWQGVATEGKPDLVTKEILDLDFSFPIPHTPSDARLELEPNLPWAEDHFLERVDREPTNPGHEYQNWPWWHGQQAVTAADPHNTKAVMIENKPGGKVGGGFKFSHTYQERFWPRNAGEGDSGPYQTFEGRDNWGIRYPYGDLDSVVDLLRREPQTRQAYFPIFFPEDTGAVHGGRIPCSLGYHFLVRSGMLHCWYDIRSCDAVRHFRDDLYLATRLVQWVLEELKKASAVEPSNDRATGYYKEPWGSMKPGTLFFKAHSFHVHMGDYHLLP